MALIILQMPNRYLPVYAGKGPGVVTGSCPTTEERLCLSEIRDLDPR